MLPASNGSPLDTSPSFPETGSIPLVSLLVASVPGCTVSVLLLSAAVVVALLLSPQTAFAAVFARLFIVSIVIDTADFTAVLVILLGDVITVRLKDEPGGESCYVTFAIRLGGVVCG